MGNFDAFNDVLRFNWVLITLNTILIVHFFSSWYLSYKKTGWKLDYWNFSMLLIYFVPYLLMYPFAGSLLNALAVGSSITIIQDQVNKAYLISFAGYMCMFLGKRIFDKFYLRNFINYLFILPIKCSVSRIYTSILSHKLTSRLSFFAFTIVFVFILFMAYKAGLILSPRDYFQNDDSIRPMYNFMLVLSSLIAQILIARVFIYNKLSDKIILAIYLVLSLFLGARSSIIAPIIEIYTFNIFLRKKGKISLLKLSVTGFFMLFLVLYLDAIRSGDTSIANTLTGMAISTFYGNSFSDLRDFAWVLGSWNGVYLYGKTYLAAFMSFIPSGLSAFRTQWSIGKVTAIMAGFDPMVHPGLRPGLFGESFLNFGLAGVIVLGLILGYIYRYIDFYIKKAAADNTPIVAFSALMSGLFILNLPITAGFFNFYFTILILLFLFAIRLTLYYLNIVIKKTNNRPC